MKTIKQIPYYIVILWCGIGLLTGCNENISISKTLNQEAPITPDYIGVTVPPNIAPLNFKIETPGYESCVFINYGTETLQLKSQKGNIQIPEKEWKEMLCRHTGDSISLTVCLKDGKDWIAFRSFSIYIAQEPCDSYVAYRLIEPAYEMWNEMGIYQRNLENFDVHTLYENTQSGKGCINCHSFCAQNPDTLLFHVRKMNPGMITLLGRDIERIDTKTPQTISPLVYPYWHPSGKFVAFSTNNTILTYHSTHPNVAEVYDDASDVVVYDVAKKEILTIPELSSSESFETFPTFAPDGRTLYFCTSPALAMPDSFSQVKYSLCRVDFDPKTRTLGRKVDTLYNAFTHDKSVSFPRISPDGHYLMFTLHNYGSFPIWHREADLWMMDLRNDSCYALKALNSEETDSYHSWSSNGKWVVFSSRRDDGWYTRLYIGYIDKEGKARKPFRLPQQLQREDNDLMKSYNIPEFVKGKVKLGSHEISTVIRKGELKKATFR